MKHLRLVPDAVPEPCPLNPDYPDECLHKDGEPCEFRELCKRVEREKAER